MDWILLSTIAVFFVVGVYRGFISTLFSFVGGWAILILSYLLCGKFAVLLQNTALFEKTIPRFVENSINKIISGEFSSAIELKNAAIASGIGGIFVFVITLFTNNVQIDGEMTAGEILSTQIATAISKLFAFLFLFIILYVLFVVAKKFSTKLTKLPFINCQNRMLGGVFGVARGLFFFLIFYGVFTSVGGLFFSEKLISVAKNGVLSQKIYAFVTKKIINLFY